MIGSLGKAPSTARLPARLVPGAASQALDNCSLRILLGTGQCPTPSATGPAPPGARTPLSLRPSIVGVSRPSKLGPRHGPEPAGQAAAAQMLPDSQTLSLEVLSGPVYGMDSGVGESQLWAGGVATGLQAGASAYLRDHHWGKVGDPRLGLSRTLPGCSWRTGRPWKGPTREVHLLGTPPLAVRPSLVKTVRKFFLSGAHDTATETRRINVWLSLCLRVTVQGLAAVMVISKLPSALIVLL